MVYFLLQDWASQILTDLVRHESIYQLLCELLIIYIADE